MDDFCRAHQIPYDGECPECALLAIDILADRAWKADEWHTGDAPDTYKQGFRAAELARQELPAAKGWKMKFEAAQEQIKILTERWEGSEDLRKRVMAKYFPIREALIDADRMLDQDIHIQSGSPWHERIKKYLK
jgi:hypothetical protein